MLLGKKIGMTQVFDDNGAVIPVTVIEAGPCVITQIKTTDKDGYSAVQIGYDSVKTPSKPLAGHLKKAKADSRFLREFTIDDTADYKVGTKIAVDLFADISKVEVSGISKGKGFAGVIKRHNFSRGPETHGSDHHRKPGSIGSMFPQRVLKGRRLPGHMGAERVTVKGLRVVSIDAKKNTLIVRGAVPGPIGCLLEIKGTK